MVQITTEQTKFKHYETAKEMKKKSQGHYDFRNDRVNFQQSGLTFSCFVNPLF